MIIETLTYIYEIKFYIVNHRQYNTLSMIDRFFLLKTRILTVEKNLKIYLDLIEPLWN